MQDTDFRKVRLEKLKKIKALGWNPYAHSFDKKQTIAEALKNAAEKSQKESEKRKEGYERRAVAVYSR